MDLFDEKIKKAVESYEAPYNEAAWQSLNRSLGMPKHTKISLGIGAIAAIAIGVLYFVNSNQSNDQSKSISQQNADNKTTVIDQNVNEPTENKLVEDVNFTTDQINENSASTVESGTNKNHSSQVSQESDNQKNTSSTQTNGQSLTNDTKVETQSDLNEESNSPIHQPHIDDQVNQKSDKDDFIAEINGCPDHICKGETITLTASKNEQSVTYQWIVENKVYQGRVVEVTLNQSGLSQITLQITDNKTHQVLAENESDVITVLKTPSPSFTYETSNDLIPTTFFKVENQDAVNVQWEIEGYYSTNKREFSYAFKKKGDYVVHLTTTNENGCSETATQIIHVEKDYNLLAPSAFSPNEDFLNDNFIPKALPYLNLPFTMTIYDKQGRMVYQTTDSNSPWDGNYMDGQLAPDGVYVWIVQLTNEKGETEIYQDQVTITR